MRWTFRWAASIMIASGSPGLSRQFGEDAVEHAHFAPADEAVVDRLVWAIALGRVALHQPVLDDVDHPRRDPPIINPQDAMRKRKKRLASAHLRLTQQKRNIHRQRLLDTAIESTHHPSCKRLNGS